jgi:hypothetical protein
MIGPRGPVRHNRGIRELGTTRGYREFPAVHLAWFQGIACGCGGAPSTEFRPKASELCCREGIGVAATPAAGHIDSRRSIAPLPSPTNPITGIARLKEEEQLL